MISNKQKAIQHYYMRRKNRLKARFDAEEENNNGGGGGHGNTKLPYGIAKAEGIDTTGMVPKEVWEALAGKGYSPAETYSKLKEGKRGSELKPSSTSTFKHEKATTKLSISHMLPEMTSVAHRKALSTYINAINDAGGDEACIRLLTLTSTKPKTAHTGFKMKKVSSGEGCQLVFSMSPRTGATSLELVVPNLPSDISGNEKTARVSSFVHELTHYINHLGGTDDSGWYEHPFTDSYKPLVDAIEKETNKPLSKELEDNFAKYREEKKKLSAQYHADKAAAGKVVMKELYGDDRPKFLDENGTIITFRYEYYSEIDKFSKARDKRIAQLHKEVMSKFRTANNCSSMLQGLCDSVMRGKLKDMGCFGHETKYFRHKGNDGNELLSCYMSMAILAPDQLKLFENNFPETAKALQGATNELIKKLESWR